MEHEMHILWFTNGPLEPLKKEIGIPAGGTGYWMTSLLEQCQAHKRFKISVATLAPYAAVHKRIGGIEYFLIPQKKHRFFPPSDNHYLQKCMALIQQIKPDIIHVHGTERFYGLLREFFPGIPFLISFQGLIGPTSEWSAYYGGINLKTVLKMETLRSFLNGSSPLRGYFRLKRQIGPEQKILRLNSYFDGRTDWDRAYLETHNPKAAYYSIPNILRDSFFNCRWDPGRIERHRIFVSNCRTARSGADLMLEAFKTIKGLYPESTLYIAGTNPKLKKGYQKYLSDLAGPFGGDCVFTGYLSAEELAEQLCKAHVFVHPTYIDNSPNSLAEALVVGTPCVASCVGGKMSMIRHNHTGLLFPNHDKYLLAERVRQIFDSDELAGALSQNGCEETRKKHDRHSIFDQYKAVYEQLSQ